MAEDEQKEVKKRCPFNNEWCGDWCPRMVTIQRIFMGQRQKSSMCVDVANNIILSEINQKTIPPQQPRQQIQIPNPLRGS